MQYIGDFKGIPIYLSDKYPKKYYALVGNKKVYFGDVRYQQYHDKMGYYRELDHWDPKRRSLFHSRHHKSKGRIGTPGWFSLHVLW